MAWTTSAIFTQAVLNPMTQNVTSTLAKPTSYTGLFTDSIKAALFTSSNTPDKNAALLSTGYNSAGSQWISTTYERTDTAGANWPIGGIALTAKVYAAGTGIVSFGAANTPGSGNVTIADVWGCLVYDDTISGGTVSKQGLCYNYFGGAQQVTGGTFTIVWDATGVFKFLT